MKWAWSSAIQLTTFSMCSAEFASFASDCQMDLLSIELPIFPDCITHASTAIVVQFHEKKAMPPIEKDSICNLNNGTANPKS
jgi:hypothetical protein